MELVLLSEGDVETSSTSHQLRSLHEGELLRKRPPCSQERRTIAAKGIVPLEAFTSQALHGTIAEGFWRRGSQCQTNTMIVVVSNVCVKTSLIVRLCVVCTSVPP